MSECLKAVPSEGVDEAAARATHADHDAHLLILAVERALGRSSWVPRLVRHIVRSRLGELPLWAKLAVADAIRRHSDRGGDFGAAADAAAWVALLSDLVAASVPPETAA